MDRTSKTEYLDALRGFAILGVVAVHVMHHFHLSPGWEKDVLTAGGRGVQLFYIVSAFTICLSIRKRAGDGSFSFFDFIARRFFRVAPLFYCAIAASIVITGIGPRFYAPSGITIESVLATATFTHGWHPETINAVVLGGWSLAVEMTFYLIFPLLWYWVTNRRRAIILLACTTPLSLVASWAVLKPLNSLYSGDLCYLVESFSEFWFFAQFPLFATGILCFYTTEKLKITKKSTASISFMFLALVLMLPLVFAKEISIFASVPRYLLVAIPFFCLLVSLHLKPWALFVNPISIWIGKLSYSIYLTHYIVMVLFSWRIKSWFGLEEAKGYLVAFLCILSISLVISVFTYFFIEKPCIRAGRSLINWRHSFSAASPNNS